VAGLGVPHDFIVKGSVQVRDWDIIKIHVLRLNAGELGYARSWISTLGQRFLPSPTMPA
jgi:hypothetical protein